MTGILPEPDEEMPDGLDDMPPITVELPDGTVEVSFGDPDEANEPDEDDAPGDHFENLADSIDDAERHRIAGELLDGIEADDQSRQDWLEQRTYGLDLLGLDPRRKAGADDDGNASVVHPLMLEAVLRFQAVASGELLPADGPAKVRDDGIIPDEWDTADALEKELNHFLTTVCTEYRPDTEKLLFWVGFGGTAFKKVYHCPLRGRPVSELVDAKDLIVSNDASDMMNAGRITQIIKLRPATLKRMQLIGSYRDCDLGAAEEDEANAIEDKIGEIQGTDNLTSRIEDRERTVYECYCEIDIAGHEHVQNGKETGLPLPYKVTIDKSSREILEIRRNYDEPMAQDGPEPLPVARQVFVKFSFVPGLGFYDLGLLHILGNSAKAATSAWRIMLDASMRAVFPGGFVDKAAMRNNDVNFRGKPGGYVPIETGGRAINDIIAPFPFRGPDPVMMQLVDNIVQTAQRVGGTAESDTSEGRADAPVGTTMALLEQQQITMNAVHKRLCASQQVELKLICERLKEHPEALFQSNPKPNAEWTRELVLQALNDHDIVPVADPNTSSHIQRVTTAQALQQLVMQAPWLFDIMAVRDMMLKMLRIPNPDKLISQNPSPTPPPDPIKAGELAVKQQLAQGKTQYDAAKIQIEALKAGHPSGDPTAASKAQVAQADAATRAFAAHSKAQVDQARVQIDAHKALADHQLAVAQHHATAPHAPAQQADQQLAWMDAQTRAVDAKTRQAALAAKVHDTMVDATQQAADRQSENQIAALNAFKELGMHSDKMEHAKADREAMIEAAKLAAKNKPSST